MRKENFICQILNRWRHLEKLYQRDSLDLHSIFLSWRMHWSRPHSTGKLDLHNTSLSLMMNSEVHGSSRRGVRGMSLNLKAPLIKPCRSDRSDLQVIFLNWMMILRRRPQTHLENIF